jgi:outer membrane protein assembly factor BamB
MAGMMGTLVSVPRFAIGQASVARKIPTRTTLANLGLERHWFSIIPLAGGTARVAAMNLAGPKGEYLFVQTTDGIVACYDSETGRRIWTAHLPGPLLQPSSVSVNKSMAVTAVGQKIYGLELNTGTKIWESQLEDIARGTGINENIAAVSLSNGKVQVFNVKHRGEHTCGERHDPENCALLKPSVGSYIYGWKANKAISSPPIVTDKFMTFASEDGKVYTASLEDRKILHRIETKGPIKGHLGTHAYSQVIVGSEDHKIYCIDVFNPEDSQTNWVFPTPSPIDRGVLVAGDEAFTVTRDGVFYSIDMKNGSERWRLDTPGRGRLLAVSPSRIYGISPDGGIAIIQRADGQILSTPEKSIQSYGVDLKNYPHRMGNDFNDRIYLATDDGLLLCLRELGAVQSAPLRDPKLPPFGTTPEDLQEIENKAAEGAPAATPAKPDNAADMDKETVSDFE